MWIIYTCGQIVISNQEFPACPKTILGNELQAREPQDSSRLHKDGSRQKLSCLLSFSSTSCCFLLALKFVSPVNHENI